MTEYKVLPGKMITGRHSKVYKAGDVFPETEALMNIDAAVERGIVAVKPSKPEPTESRSAKRRRESPPTGGAQKKGGNE